MSAYPKTLLWIRRVLQTIRALPHLWLFRRVSVRPIIEKDMARWLDVLGQTEQAGPAPWRRLLHLLRQDIPEFRSLFYYRVERDKSVWNRLLLEMARLLYRPRILLLIRTPSVGPGLFIQHGFSSGIGAKSIGENCWINQQVTIGWDKGGAPAIGNNVMIAPGAQVFGNITIGDNVIIGANAVVFKNVPPNCTVVGVPAYIVKRDGKKTKEPL